MCAITEWPTAAADAAVLATAAVRVAASTTFTSNAGAWTMGRSGRLASLAITARSRAVSSRTPGVGGIIGDCCPGGVGKRDGDGGGSHSRRVPLRIVDG